MLGVLLKCAMLLLYNFPVDLFAKPKIKMFTKSIQINRPLNVPQTAVIPVDLFHQIEAVCDSLFQFYEIFLFIPTLFSSV